MEKVPCIVRIRFLTLKYFPNFQDLFAMHETTIKLWHEDLTFPTVSCLTDEPTQCKWPLCGTFHIYGVQATCSLKGIFMQAPCPDQQKSDTLHSKCWSYPGIWEPDYFKDQSRKCHWRRWHFQWESWEFQQLFQLLASFFFLNSEEAQAGFPDKPVIAYVGEKPTAL